MSTNDERLWLRSCRLIVSQDDKGLDLSEMHIKFQTYNADVQSPNHAAIRVYNLSEETVKKIRGEFSRVTLQAGYQNGTEGVIFDGNIKQFRIGKEQATTTYLDILAADGDEGYNFGVVNKTLAAGSTPAERVAVATSAMGAEPGYSMNFTGGVLPRGKVLFGMARDEMRKISNSHQATWSIQNGKVQVLPLQGYLPDEAVVLNSLTGLIGLPEQTEEGLRVRSLLNPRIQIGGLIKVDQKAVNQTLQQNPNAAPIPFNQYAGVQLLANISADGTYRVYVAEHSGDTRGNMWFTDMICLAVDQSSSKTLARV